MLENDQIQNQEENVVVLLYGVFSETKIIRFIGHTYPKYDHLYRLSNSFMKSSTEKKAVTAVKFYILKKNVKVKF